MQELEWLEKFFWSCCQNGWGNERGIKIHTLSNPGWSMEIILEDTDLENHHFEKIDLERNEHDWVICWMADKKFQGRGGVQNLSEIIKIFRNWVEEFDRANKS